MWAVQYLGRVSKNSTTTQVFDKRARWLGVIGLHENTFKPFTNTKTSIIFLQKWGRNDDCDKKDYPIFTAVSKKPGKDKSGNLTHTNGDIDSDLPNIAKDFVKFAKKNYPKLKILLVTILTSISSKSIKKIGHTKSIKELIKKQATMAKECRCHGIVCAGSDLDHVKKIFKGEIVTPGIRLKGDSAGDQKRIMRPKEAFEKGSTALVLGRSIIKGNIKKNISRLIKELN